VITPRITRLIVGFVVGFAAISRGAEPRFAADEPFDLVVSGGQVVDGSGNPWFHGDVAIRGDRIVAVGKLPAGPSARRTIDARGLVVAPGFIDIHSHSDWVLLQDGNAPGKIRQGVTTEVLGEDHSGGPHKGKLAAKVVSVKGNATRLASLDDYFRALESSGVATNIASYVGLGNLWASVMGDSFDRPSTEEKLAMAQLLDEALSDGAIGLSTMLAAPQEMVATTDDLVALCEVVRKHGGLYSSHIRNEGTDVFEAVREAIAIGERSGAPVDVIHLKIADQSLWGRMKEIVAIIEQARSRGVNVQANVYPYTRGNNDLVSIIPPWGHEGGKPAMLARLQNAKDREHLKRDVKAGLPGWYNHYLAVGGDWSRMLVSARLSEKNRRFEGMTMDKVLAARDEGRAPTPDPLDELFDFLVEENGSVGAIYAHHTEEDMNLALVQPWCSIGSDGSAFAVEGELRTGHPHPRNFGTFPRALGVYVRERGLLRLEDAIRKMSSLNATKVGLVDRGMLRSGMFADVTVFDPKVIIDRATYLEPFQYPEGIAYVIVNGRVVLDDGKATLDKPGRVLRKALKRS
jgi:N-acyl-D-amino-acid deacylase